MKPGSIAIGTKGVPEKSEETIVITPHRIIGLNWDRTFTLCLSSLLLKNEVIMIRSNAEDMLFIVHISIIP